SLLFHEVRAELLLNQPRRAVALFEQACKDQKGSLHQYHESQLVSAMAEAGLALEAYRVCGDKKTAFANAAPVLLRQKKTAQLLQLILEYSKAQPDDPNRLFQAGELYLLRE